MTKVGIVGYGAYTPHRYVAAIDIDARAVGLGLDKKSVAAWDEDSVTMGVEAARQALIMAQVEASQVEAIYMGSESPPYAVKPSSTIVGDFLGVGEAYQAVDLQFACKAAAAGFQMAYGQLQSGQISHALVIGADKSQAKKGDALEWSAGAAAAAVLLGRSHVLATLVARSSVSSDTPDFWRRDGMDFPSHAGRFTGEPGYFHHIEQALTQLMDTYHFSPTDFDHVILHMPNGKFPKKLAHDFHFRDEQLQAGFTVTEIGNPYAASVLFGLTAVLDQAKPGQKILLVAYGSGAGADALVLETTSAIETRQPCGITSRLHHRVQLPITTYFQEHR